MVVDGDLESIHYAIVYQLIILSRENGGNVMRQQHKHYYTIRAFADGWKIEVEMNYRDGIWAPTDHPVFSKSGKYRVVPDENGWLPWYGGECPVDGTALVDVRLFNGKQENEIALARDYRWSHNNNEYNIVAYRVVKKAVADPYAELKAAAKDPTKVIVHLPSTTVHEYPACVGSNFTDEPACYEIRNKPKKVKLRAYIDGVSGELLWRLEGHKISSYWKRVPSEDKEVEVEE